MPFPSPRILSFLICAFGWSVQFPLLSGQSCPEGFSFSYRRFEKEIRAFEAQKSVPRHAIVFYGSSSIRMWESLKEDFAPLPVVNRGFGGATLAEMNFYFKRVIVPLKPSVLVVYGGENDLAHPAYCMDSVQQRFRTFMKLRERFMPQTPVVFILIKNSPKRRAFRSQFDAFSTWVKAQASQYEGLYLFDGDEPLRPHSAEPSPHFFKPDSLHLGPEGYRAWAQGLRPLLLRLYKGSDKAAF